MRFLRTTGKICSALLLVFSMHINSHAQEIDIVPKPAELKMQKGNFEITGNTALVYDRSNKDLARIAGFLSGHMEQYYKMNLASSQGNGGVIRFEITSLPGLDKEGYTMKIDKNGILISAPAANGIFYGFQTLKQMLPSDPAGKMIIPYAEIKDQPRFAWRGMMLDVCRHFFPVSYIKKFLDNMAMYKLNTFHWHLTDDQGWRIEIKKYPGLADISSWRDETLIGHGHKSQLYDGIGYGGFYTQDQIREIVQYAADRFITVVPEIEMPGHSSAALAAYPELGCTGGPYQVQKSWGVFKDVYCAGKEETFRFLQDVIDEVCELFPSEYIHIGGDECPKDAWKECPLCTEKDQG